MYQEFNSWDEFCSFAEGKTLIELGLVRGEVEHQKYLTNTGVDLFEDTEFSRLLSEVQEAWTDPVASITTISGYGKAVYITRGYGSIAFTQAAVFVPSDDEEPSGNRPNLWKTLESGWYNSIIELPEYVPVTVKIEPISS